jgi:hypothetical protein
MRKELLRAIGALVIVSMITTAHGQSAQRFEVEIPFQFDFGGRTLPSGKYAVGRLDPSRPNIVLVRNVDNGISLTMLCQRVEAETPTESPFLLFKAIAGKYYLFQVWNVGSLNGNQLPTNEKVRSQDKKSLLVELRAKKSSNESSK